MSTESHSHHEEPSPHAAITRTIGNFLIPFLIVLFVLTLGGGGLALFKGALTARAVAAQKAALLLTPPPDAAESAIASAAPAAPVTAVKFEGPPLEVEVLPDTLTPVFRTTEIKAKAGQLIKVRLRNASATMPHNFVVLKPGSIDALIPLTDKMMTDPKGMEKGYIPESPLILAHTKLVMMNQEDSVEFTLPAKGEYPYVCTFPGHILLMRGKILVE